MNTNNLHDLTHRRMDSAGLGRWIEPCRILLEHFSGIERVIECPEELPSRVVLAAMRAAIQQPSPMRYAYLRRCLSRLPLFEYRAAAAAEIWHPLEEPLERFHLRHHGKVHFWRAWEGHPSPDEVTAWLSRWIR
jgi:hypothetical protein